MNCISKKARGIVFENDYFSYTIAYDGKVIAFTDKKDGKNYISNESSPYFCFLEFDGSAKFANPINMEFDGENLVFGFISGSYLKFKPEVKDNYITFELVESNGVSCYKLIFANTLVNYPIVEGEDHFAMSNLSMKLNTKAVSWPSYKEMKAGGITYSETGIIGAKMAIFGAPVSKHVEILKEIASDIPKGDAPVAYGKGGPWARENKDIRGDYIIISASKPEQLEKELKMYTDLNVDQLDFHKGAPFRQGDFYFHTDETGEASAFKEKMVSQLTPHGIKAGLHIYSFYIDPFASGLLSDPKWQKQLLPAEKYTLAEDISDDSTEIATEESTENALRYIGYRALASEFILVDEELIWIKPVDVKGNGIKEILIGDKGFAGLERGIAGTKPAAHKKGAKITRIASYYSGLCPIIGSELYYEVARRVAKAYNEGGFGMIYFDALDGVSRHLTDKNLSWYYAAAFVNEVLKYTDNTPIVEMSFFDPPFYLSRGRAGAWDHPRRGYKIWNNAHVKSNAKTQDSYLCAILGWYNLYPTPPANYPPSAHVKYHFFDDVDHMASLGIAYDFGMVYQNVREDTLAIPAFRRNNMRYAFYNKLRKENYFPESVKRKVREGKYEYALVENNGAYAFAQKSYSPNKILDIDDSAFNTTSNFNPFPAQKPFIRLEAFPTTDGADPILALELDENKPLCEQKLEKEYPLLDALNAKDHYGLHFKVFGNGSDDSLLIRIRGVLEGDHNATDYYIPLNFNGWKEFFIVDVDNAEYDFAKFEGVEHGHYLDERGMTNFARLQFVNVYLGGKCEGVKMSSIELCTWLSSDVVDPSIKVGDNELTFKCTLHGGEYIEYNHGEDAVIYDKDGNSRPVDDVIGEINAPSGSFNSTLTRANAGDVQTKTRLTFGFTGEIIK